MAQADAPPLLDRDPMSDVPDERRISVAEAKEILGISPRTVERMVDDGRLAGGRRAPITPLSHRWIDVRHAVQIAVANGRTAAIPEQWRHLISPR